MQGNVTSMLLIDFHSDLLRLISSHLDPCSKTILKFTCRRMSTVLPSVPGKKRIMYLLNSAAYYGHLNVMKWLLSKHYVWDPYSPLPKKEYDEKCSLVTQFSWPFSSFACAFATKNDQLHILKWLKQTNHFDSDACLSLSSSHGYNHILTWMKEERILPDPSKYICSNAASNGHLNTLIWLVENGYPCNSHTCKSALENGHLDVLKWLAANGQSLDFWILDDAAKYGHLHILQWAKLQGYPLEDFICCRAAQYGHLHILKWARSEENGVSWDERTCS